MSQKRSIMAGFAVAILFVVFPVVMRTQSVFGTAAAYPNASPSVVLPTSTTAGVTPDALRCSATAIPSGTTKANKNAVQATINIVCNNTEFLYANGDVEIIGVGQQESFNDHFSSRGISVDSNDSNNSFTTNSYEMAQFTSGQKVTVGGHFSIHRSGGTDILQGVIPEASAIIA